MRRRIHERRRLRKEGLTINRSNRRRPFPAGTAGALLWLLILVALLAAGYLIARNIELRANSREEIRGDLSERFFSEGSIRLGGKRYVLRDGIFLLPLIQWGGPDGNAPRQIHSLVLLVIDSKNKALHPIQIPPHALVPSVGLLAPGGTPASSLRIADALSMAQSDAQRGEYIIKAVSNLFFGLEIQEYMALQADAGIDPADYMQALKELLQADRIGNILNNQDDSLVTNIKSDRLLSMFLSFQNYRRNDIMMLEGEEKADGNGAPAFFTNSKQIEDIAIALLLMPEEKPW